MGRKDVGEVDHEKHMMMERAREYVAGLPLFLDPKGRL